MMISNKLKRGLGYNEMSSSVTEIEYKIYYTNLFLPFLMALITLFIITNPGQALAAEQSPTIHTQTAVSVEKNSVVLQAIINPGGLETTYYFEYGMNTKYKTSRRKKPLEAGSGTENILVSFKADRLHPNTIYHYRIVAQNSAGITYGKDMTLKTLIDYSDGTDIGIPGGGDNCSCG